MPEPDSPPAAPPRPPVRPPDLSVQLGRLRLPNPILVASGTFGYGREMTDFVDLARLGGVVPKTITPLPRQGNVPWLLRCNLVFSNTKRPPCPRSQGQK